jgi:Ca2+-binding RTX toxin-like protein
MFTRWLARISSAAGRDETTSARVAVTTPSAAAPRVTLSTAVKVTTPATVAPDGTGSNGGAGSDVIFGGAGADGSAGEINSEGFIFDGPGADTIYGGRGNDAVFLDADGTPDTVTCGPGHDVVWGATSENTVAANCEVVHVKTPSCRSLPQQVLAPLREAARCNP